MCKKGLICMCTQLKKTDMISLSIQYSNESYIIKTQQ